MHRFYLAPQHCSGDLLSLSGGEAHHALHVLRLRHGDEAAVLDGVGTEFLCNVESHSRDTVLLRIKKKTSAMPYPCQITLLVGIPKGKIIESIIQKSVELGAHRIVPLLTERAVIQLDDDQAENKREKWQQVAVEAIKQCGAAWLPEVATPTTIKAFLERQEHFELALVGSLQKERRHPRDVFEAFRTTHGHPPKAAAIWIGPEGDFTPAELSAIEGAGAQPITLGNLTLRVETAAIYCLSVINYELSQRKSR